MLILVPGESLVMTLSDVGRINYQFLTIDNVYKKSIGLTNNLVTSTIDKLSWAATLIPLQSFHFNIIILSFAF